MTSVEWVLVAIATLGASGLPGLLGAARSPFGQRLSVALMLIGSAFGWVGVVMALTGGGAEHWTARWVLPAGGFSLTLDALSAIFLAPVFAVPALGAIYGLGYWRQAEHTGSGRQLSAFYGLLAGAMALVVVAGDGVLFLIAWEIMALSGYFAMTADDRDPAVCRAGWIYLVYTHVGTLCLVAMFTLWHGVSGSWALTALTHSITPEAANAIFLLALIGFGCKAGLVPLHSWVPGADAAAPCHVAAVKSSVMQNMGLYGILRLTSLITASPSWWGGLVIAIGAITGVIGISGALGQRDLKRLLAYSSIENIGIATLGVGLALLGRAEGRPAWVVLGLGGAFLHLWNHSLFKSLLFFNVGAVVQATGTSDLERLGGLGRRMPRTAAFFLLGAGAICALPPLNGFASEWLLYLGLFNTVGGGPDGGSGWAWAGVGAAALAAMGAMAVACFVKAYGMAFLGTPRDSTVATAAAHDPAAPVLSPMLVLSLACIALGIVPFLAVPELQRAAGAWLPAVATTPVLLDLAPLTWLSWLSIPLLAGVALLGGLIWRGLRTPTAAVAQPTWSCGYARPTSRMQYSAGSFGHTLTELFRWALWPRTVRPRLRALFAPAATCEHVQPEPVLDRLVLPAFQRATRFLPWLRMTQQGRVQIYVAYFVGVVLLLILWSHLGI